MDKTEKKNVKKPLYLLFACLGVMLVSVLVVVFVKWNKAEPVMNEVGVQLYWNIDRDEYVGDSSAGVNSRERAEDGFYKVRFAVDGEQVEYNVEKARLMHKIDTMDVMGLAIDEEGTIIDVFDPEDITGGEVASMYYVVFGSDETITVCPNEDLEDDYKILTVTENTGIYNVTGLDPVGHKDSVLPSDCVRAFQNEDGEITHVFIVSRYGYWAGEVVQKTCEHCDELVDWYVWEDKYSLPTETGHWILENDVKASAQYKIGADQQVFLDLNGKTVKGSENRRVYAMTGENAYLAIMDSSAEGTGTVIGRGAPDNGGIVLVRYGTFELYGGTLDASNIETLQFGSAVRVNKEAVFNMYNGTVIGGTALGSMDEEEKSTKGGYGGTIQVGGTFNMYDGVVRDGTALRYDKKDGGFTCGNGGNIHIGTDGIFNMYGGKILNGTAQRAGGNIYMSTNAVVNMSGGTISGGAVMDDDRYGGNIYVAEKAQALNLTGGTIEKGKALGAGGNIALYSTMNMSGGTVTGGSCMTGETLAEGVHNPEYPHHNIYCAGGTLNMSGGLVEGYVRIRDTAKKECTVNISGTAQIKGGSINLSLDPGDDVNFGTLKKGADIRINGGGYVSTKTAKANVAYVRSSYAGVETKYLNNKIFIGKQACVCGETESHIGDCNGTLLDWIPWGTTTSMPNVEANWYLVCDVTMKDQVKIEEKATFRLDLNGHRVTGAEDMRVYALRNGGINMIVTDHSAENDGVIMGRGQDMGRGAVIWVSDNGSLKMYGGTLDGSAATSLYNGTTVSVDADCKFVMYDGKLVGGTSKCLVDKKGKSTNGYGGTLAVSGTFDMYGGKIVDGTCEKHGGNIFVGKTGTFNLRGGEVSGGSTASRGGNIAGTGKINLYGGLVTKGTAGAGGNILITTTGSFVGGTVSDGTAKHGGNIIVAKGATWTMSGGSVTGGVATSSNGGNIESEADTVVTLSGGVVSGGVAPVNGGNIFISGELTMSKVSVADGKATEKDGKGGNVYVNGGKFVMKSGTISGGTGDYGGSVSVSGTKETNGQIDVYGGSIIGGTSAKRGGNIFVGKTGTFNLRGGEVSGGSASASNRGGNIAGTGEINLYGGVVTKGTAGAGGNIVISGTGSFVDGTVSGGTAKHGGNILVEDGATWTMSGGSVSGGIATSSNGGNIEVEVNSVVKLGGGKVSGGVAPANGGNIFISGELTMNKVSVADGKATEKDGKGGNVYVNGGKLVMKAGTITGGTGDYGGSVAVSGNGDAIGQIDMHGGLITGGTSASRGGNIFVGKTGVFNLHKGEVSGGSASVSNRGGNIAGTGAINLYGGVVTKGTAGAGGNIVISGTGSFVDGTVSGGTAKHGGNILVEEGATWTMSGGSVTGGIATSSNGGNIEIEVNSVVKLDGGKVSGGVAPANGGNIFISGELTMNKVSVADGQVTEKDGKAGNVYVNGGKLVMKAGTITGGTGDYGGSVAVSGNGDAIGQIDMHGGLITGGTSASRGGNIFVGKTGVFNLHKGEVSGGSASASSRGGNIAGTGAINLYGGVVTKGTAGAGGNILISGTGSLVDGTVTDGTAKHGGNILVEDGATWTMSGGSVSGGIATSSNGGNIETEVDSVVKLDGGKVSGGVAPVNGGNIFISGELTIGDAQVADGKTTEADGKGGNVYVNGGKFVMTSGIVSGGTSDFGGSVAVSGNGGAIGQIDVHGGLITGGTSTNRGGNIFVGGTGCFNLHGGEVSSGSTETRGGNIAGTGAINIYGGVVTKGTAGAGGNIVISGTGSFADGTVSDGTAKHGGNILVEEGAAWTMSGGSVSGGEATSSSGGNIEVEETTTIQITGGTITGGIAKTTGGNVYLAAASTVDGSPATFILSGDAVITKGEADTQGGNVYLQQGKLIEEEGKETQVTQGAIFKMNGGSITDGKAKAASANVVALGQFEMTDGTISGGEFIAEEGKEVSATVQAGANVYTKPGERGCSFTMSGGTIEGYVRANYSGEVAIGGTAKITGGETNLTLGMTNTGNAVVSVGEMKEGAMIKVNPLYEAYFATDAVSGDEVYFAPDPQYKLIELVENDKLIIVADWEPWTKTDSLPTKSGMYYLTGNVTLNAAAAIEDSTVLLDLKGYTVETSEDAETIPRVYVLRKDGILNIYDSSAEGTGKIVSHRKSSANAGVIELREEGATFNLYGGTVDASDVELPDKVEGEGEEQKTTHYNGAAVYVNSGTTFNMYGGRIIGGKAYNGGSVYVNINATFNMEGGEVTSGEAVNHGGNVYVKADTTDGTNSGIFNMSGGVLTGGNAKQGGNVYLQADSAKKTGAAELHLSSNGAITSGTAETGGNIAALGVLEMTGGEISGGTATSNQTGGNVYTTPGNNGCTFTMSGGTIAGLVRVNSAGSVTLSGSAKIKGAEGETGLTLTDKPARIVTSELKEDAEIYVNLEYVTYYLTYGEDKEELSYFAEIEKAEDLNCIKADDGSVVELAAENKLILVKDWTDSETLPTNTGNYRLTTNVTLSKAASMAKDATVYLDLNGCSVTGTKCRIYQFTNTGSTLSIYDTNPEKTGTLETVRTEATTGVGGLIYLKEKENTFNLYRGTLESNFEVSANGGVVYVNNDCEFNMYGGTINGGTAEQGGNVYVKAGTETLSAGIFNMHGGSITGGTAETGGNVAALGVFDMTGGEISGGTATGNATGGNVYTTPGNNGCTFTMSGGTIAGLVRVNSTGSVTLGGSAKIKGGDTNLTLSDKPARIITSGLNADAEIYVNPEYLTYHFTDTEDREYLSYFAEIKNAEDAERFKADDGSKVEVTSNNKLILVKEWTDTKALPAETGNYRLMSNVIPSAAAAVAQDAIVYLDLNGCDVTATDRRIYQFTKTGATLSIYDSNSEKTGTIKANRDSSYNNYGGLIFIRDEGTFNLYGGILDASGFKLLGDKGFGGAVYVNTGCEFNMYGGTITGGTAAQGGNVYVVGSSSGTPGTFNMSGGTISGGEGTTAAGNVAALGIFNMTGGTITGGTCNVSGAHKYGANVYTRPGLNGGAFTMTGGTIAGLIRVNQAGTLTIGGDAKITSGTFTGSTAKTVTCGMFVSTTGATFAIDEENKLATGAEICLGESGMASGTKIMSGAIEEAYQGYFNLCGGGNLEFKSSGIYVAE